MEVCYIRLPRYACDDDDASRLITKNLVSLLDDGRLVGNIKDTSFCVTDLTKFLPLILTFMQIEYLIFLSVERCSRRELREIADYDMTRYAYPKRAGRIAAVERDAAVLPGTWNFREATDGGKSLTSSRSEEVAGKSDVFYKDTKVTSKAIWEALQGLGCCCCETGEFGLASWKREREREKEEERKVRKMHAVENVVAKVLRNYNKFYA